MRRIPGLPLAIIVLLSGKDAAGRAKGPTDRIGRFGLGKSCQAI
jgi:hypothetical protein